MHNLGVPLDPQLHLENQEVVVPRGALAQLVCPLQLYLSRWDLTMVVNALLTLRLDYCDKLDMGTALS